MTMRELYAALFAKFPQEEKQVFESDDSFFSEEELEILAEMKAQGRTT
jgi:hypothetical protein